jgi:hypothetical protein
VGEQIAFTLPSPNLDEESQVSTDCDEELKDCAVEQARVQDLLRSLP